jgi:hypothetical protein
MHKSAFMQSSFLNNHLVSPLERRGDEIWFRDLPIPRFIPYPLPRLNRQRFEQMCSLLHAFPAGRPVTWHLYLAQAGPRWDTFIEPEVLRNDLALLKQHCPNDAKERSSAEPMLLIGCLKTVATTDRSQLIELLPASDGLFIAWHPSQVTLIAHVRGQIHFLRKEQLLTDAANAEPIRLG